MGNPTTREQADKTYFERRRYNTDRDRRRDLNRFYVEGRYSSARAAYLDAFADMNRVNYDHHGEYYDPTQVIVEIQPVEVARYDVNLGLVDKVHEQQIMKKVEIER